MKNLAEKIGRQIRSEIIANGGHEEFEGECIKASEMMVIALRKNNIKANDVLCYVLFDNDSGCTDAPYTSHYYVEAIVGEDVWFIDCTATQFNWAMTEPQPEVLVLKNEFPHWYLENEPSEVQLEDWGW